MAKITKVPNGPLIKKKGPYAGSTLKSGGKIKKAINGTTTTQTTNPPMTKRDSTVANIKEQARLRQNLVDFRKKVGNKPLTPELIREKDSLKGLLSNFGTKQRMKSTGLTEQQLAKNDSIYAEQQRRKKSEEDDSGQLRGMGNDKPGCSGSQRASERRVRKEARRKNGGPIKKLQNGGGGKAKKEYVNRMNTADSLMSASDRQIKDGNYLNMISNKPDWNRPSLRIGKENREKARKLKDKKPLGPTRFKAGGMIKRADGSMSRRGLWDNIRKNKGSGKKPTKQMLVQEKKIKAKSKK